eukprot:CAMPEP_0202778046 /NCGR_PEP_ID=MMETSP1388-20130828/53853_1 /ASSEMBLY_ACC=CAM_ASM_000864 /TAXON_ID=37098 /ORGANISM="Isochrysis sp, Strain CCMP1244" /LENGTH=74 /DNA_ID=CAMNT_0049447297 /DNA_START=343 /DNA_END=567 /DNA_ORIENTATION=-
MAHVSTRKRSTCFAPLPFSTVTSNSYLFRLEMRALSAASGCVKERDAAEVALLLSTCPPVSTSTYEKLSSSTQV